MNVATVAFDERHDDDWLIKTVSKHLVHMRITGIHWFDYHPLLYSMSYRIPIPAGIDICQLEARITQVMEPRFEAASAIQLSDDEEDQTNDDIWSQVFDLSLGGRFLHIHVDARVPPYKVFQELFCLSWEEASRYRMERTAVTVCEHYEDDDSSLNDTRSLIGSPFAGQLHV